MHIYVPGPKLRQWNFTEISQLSIQSGEHKFPTIFGVFAIFHSNFVKIVSPSGDGNKHSLAQLKEQSLLKMKKALGETQTLCAGHSNAEPKNFCPAADPLPDGAGWPKFNQLEMVTTFTYRPSLVQIDARNFELSW